MRTVFITCDWCGKEIKLNKDIFYLNINDERGRVVQAQGKTIEPFLSHREICSTCAKLIFNRIEGEKEVI